MKEGEGRDVADNWKVNYQYVYITVGLCKPVVIT